MYETNLCFFNPSHEPFQMCYLLDVEGHLYAKHIIQSYCDTCLFDVCSSLQALHIPLKYRCPIKKGDHRMPTYRNPFKYGRHTYCLPPPPLPHFWYIESTKAVKFIQHDGKSKLKGHKFGFLEKGIDCTQVLVSQLSEIGQPML